MNSGGARSERALLLTPHGRDARIATSILHGSGIQTACCDDLPALLEELETGAGLAIIADEMLRDADLRPMVALLRSQPPWSDVPLIVLSRRGGGPESNPASARIAGLLGNVAFIERPFHPATLASVARSALRGRLRQYEARSRMAELSDAEQRLQTALQGGRLGSWTLDVERMLLGSSDTFRAHFGRRADEAFAYAELCAAVHPQDLERWQAALRHSIENRADYGIDYRVIWPDGSRHWIEARARAIADAQGRVVQLVGVSSDITERKHAEQERDRLVGALAAERAALADLTRTLERRVQESTAELINAVEAREKAQEQLLQSQKMETIGQLTGGVAHDFNNLLTAVMANLDLLRRRVRGDDDARQLIDSAMQGAARGAALTQRMLAFARQQDLRTTAVDLGELMHGMRTLLLRSLGPGIALTIETEDDLPAAQVDANQLELAVLNLVINARDAMPRGGSIRIDVGRRRENSDTTPHAGQLRIRVEDDGQGMDEETLRRAVEPFFSTKPPGKGTGLGLSMVHGLAVQLGGSLDLRSTPGNGTVATLCLPVSDGEPVHQDASADASHAPHCARILVVDDDPLIRTSTAALLEELGHQVVEADCARSALQLLETHPVDAVVTDHAMPEVTGLEFIEIARSRHPHLPILLTTGYAELPAGKTAGVPRLTKPFGLAQLDAAIARLLEAHVPDPSPLG